MSDSTMSEDLLAALLSKDEQVALVASYTLVACLVADSGIVVIERSMLEKASKEKMGLIFELLQSGDLSVKLDKV